MKLYPTASQNRPVGFPRRSLKPLWLLPLFLLGACAVEAPTGPSVPVMPGDGKSLSQFQQDDATCRQFATQQTGGASPAAAANQAAVGSAVVGTGLGAATGAIIGAGAGNPAAGAIIGAGAGLLAGSAVGAGNAAASADNVQQRYDIAYQQCMATTGNKPAVAAAPQPVYSAPAPVYVTPAPVYPAPYYYYPGYYYPGAYYGPAYYGPGFYPSTTFVFGFHGGGGYYHHH
jgi:outer membrane lipoprotein SlyB